jgi:hypothetical protein
LVADCKDHHARAVLAFLIPIFYPEKPTRITITWANTIFGSFRGEREVDWAGLMHELVQKLLKALPKAKSTPLSSYLTHLYRHSDNLMPDETRHYVEQEKIWDFGETESDADSDESEPETTPPGPSPLPPSPAGAARSGARRKITPRSEDESGRRVRSRIEDPEADELENPEDPCNRIMVAARELRGHIAIREEMLDAIGSLVGCANRSSLVEAVEAALTNSNRIRELEATERRLEAEKKAMEEQLRIRGECLREANQKAVNSALAIAHVREALAIPADVVNKAKLFEARLAQEGHLPRNKIIRFLLDQANRMDTVLAEVRMLADNMLPDSPPATTQKKTQTAPQAGSSGAGPSRIVEEAPVPEEGSSKGRKRKLIHLEEPESSGEDVVTPFQQGDPDVVEVEAPARPAEFKSPAKRKQKYRNTPLRRSTEGESGSARAGVEDTTPDESGTPGSGAKVARSPPGVFVTPQQGSTPPSSGSRPRTRSHASGGCT